MAAKKIALFIDADNVSAKFGKRIIDELESRGELFLRRIYGNWEKISLHGWNDCILNFSLRAVQQPDFVTGKNATDMSLTIDAMDVLHAGTAEIFALVSNDSDFTPLVIRLREGGRTIIGLGNSNASNAFRAACNEFIDLDAAPKIFEQSPPKVDKKISHAHEKISSVQMSLFDEEKILELPPQPDPTPQNPQPVTKNPKVISLDERKLQSDRDKKIQQMHDTLRDSAKAHGDADGFSSINYARQDVKNKNFNFTVHDFGYGQLREFIIAYPKLYDTRQDDTGRKFCYRCRDDRPPTLDDKLKKFHSVLNEAIAAHADGDGFADLCAVGTYVNKKNLGFGVKDFGHATLQKFLAAFHDLYEMRRSGDKIFLRCRVNEPTKIDGAKLQKFHATLSEISAAQTNDDGFVDLCYAGQNIRDKNLGFGFKDFGYTSLQKFIAAFPNLYELRTSGYKIFYRCRTNEAIKIDADKLKKFHGVLSEAIAAHADGNGFTDLCAVGSYVNKKNLGFTVKDFGHASLQKFLAAFPSKYELRASGTKIFLRCRVNEPIKISDDRINQLHDLLQKTAAAHADATGFTNLSLAGNFLGKSKIGFGIRSLGYSTLQKFVENFPALYEVRKSTAGTLYRCRVNDSQKSSDADKVRTLHGILRETAANYTDLNDSGGFTALNRVAQKFPVQGLVYGSLSKFVNAFPNIYDLKKVGSVLYYRCRQIQK